MGLAVKRFDRRLTYPAIFLKVGESKTLRLDGYVRDPARGIAVPRLQTTLFVRFASETNRAKHVVSQSLATQLAEEQYYSHNRRNLLSRLLTPI